MQKILLKNTRYRTATALSMLFVFFLLCFVGIAGAAGKTKDNSNAFVISKKTSRSENSVRLKATVEWKKKLSAKSPWGKFNKIGKHGISSRPTIAGDALYVGSAKKVFYSLDLSSGDERWKFKADSAIDGDAAVKGDTVCFGTIAGVLHCLDKNTGKELWNFKVRSEIIAAPLLTKEYVYFTSAEDRVYVLDRRSGKKIWSYSAIAPHYVLPLIITSPIVRDSDQGRKVFVLLANGFLTGLDGARGKELWSRKVLSSKINVQEEARRRVTLTEDKLFVIDDRGIVLVIDQEDGVVKESYPIIKTIDFIVKGEKIYLLGEELIVEVNRRSGEVLWSTDLNHGKPSAMELLGEHLLVLSRSIDIPFDVKYLKRSFGHATTYHLATGDESWTEEFKQPITALDVGNKGKALALVNIKGVLRIFRME